MMESITIRWYGMLVGLLISSLLAGFVLILVVNAAASDKNKSDLAESQELGNIQFVDASGWKQVQSDVLRKPPKLLLFTVLHSSGCHLAATVLLVFSFLSCKLLLGSTIDSTLNISVTSYVLMQFIGGVGGGSVHKLYGGKNTNRGMMLELYLIPIGAFLFVLFTSYCGQLRTYPVDTFLKLNAPNNISFTLVLIITACNIPLHILGYYIGRQWTTSVRMATSKLKRPIPEKPFWFLPGIWLCSGILPLLCISVELHYFLMSLGSRESDQLYFFQLTACCCYIVSAGCVGIICVYIMISNEDYRWIWLSFLAFGSTSLYSMCYGAYLFVTLQLDSIVHFFFFFFSCSLISLCLFLIGGVSGFLAASFFIEKIYGNLKSE